MASGNTGADADPHDPGPAVAAADLLNTLDAARREAFVLTQILGLSYEETATVLEVPIGTVRARGARAQPDLVAAVRPALANRPDRPSDPTSHLTRPAI